MFELVLILCLDTAPLRCTRVALPFGGRTQRECHLTLPAAQHHIAQATRALRDGTSERILHAVFCLPSKETPT